MDEPIPRYIVWSTDQLDRSGPFQRKWLIQQILLHGRAEDIAHVDLEEVEALLDQIRLPSFLRNFWKDYLEHVHAQS